MEKKTLKKYRIPNNPGVYFFKRGREVLYVGKATSLKDRVKSYFSQDILSTRGPLIFEMLSLVTKITWKETETVLEALILEASLIKKHKPKYNTDGKDDKSFNYVCFTKEKLPKVLMVRGKNLNNLNSELFSKIYGPFTSGGQLKEAMKIIRRIFPYLDKNTKNNYEFYRQLGLAPEIKDRKAYLKNIKNIKLLFAGKKQRILKNLEKEMKLAARAKEFERAGELKRQFFALRHINDIALLKRENPASQNFSDFHIEGYDVAHLAGKNMVGVMVVVKNGEIIKGEYRKFKIKTKEMADDTGALKEILERRFTHPEWRFPDLVVVDGGRAQLNVARKTITSLRNLKNKISVASVLKDERHKPKEILGEVRLILKNRESILLANAEAHRFALAFHKNLRAKNFLKKL